ncbi:GLUT4 regulating protein TUG-domain-containing protein [Gaertneriomyces semiglobifer]|nr:GLUT4 regulating protein TUG-domain-containing protein [Gaertneriomyces semiglobifer]
MSSNVTVTLESEPYRKVVVKTTPAMTLKSITDSAVQQMKLSGTGWGLKYGKNVMDLSLSVRFANLAAGAKLTLVKTKGSAGNLVAIALQLDGNERLVDKFLSDSTTLWKILQHFEKLRRCEHPSLVVTQKLGFTHAALPFSDLNLTRRTASTGYLMPVCLLMNREFNTLEMLMSTTLKDVGLVSGNGVIRLSHRGCGMSLDDAMREVERLEATAPAPVDNKSTMAPVSQRVSRPSLASETSSPSTEPVQPSQNEVMAPREVPTAQRVLAPQMPETRPLEQDGASQRDERTVAEDAHETSGEGDEQSYDREIKIYRPPVDSRGPTQIELPDSFFELTSAELKFLIQSSKSRAQANDNAPLMTKAMRDREQAARQKKYPKTMIRVRFRDRWVLQAQFLSNEEVSNLYDVVRSVLDRSDRSFVLYTTPPYQVIDAAVTFWQAGLAPATVVYCKWTDEAAPDGPELSSEWRARAQDHPGVPTDIPSSAVLPGAGTSAATEQGHGTLGAGHRLTDEAGPSRPLEKSSREGSSRPSTGNGKPTMPKWFKIGRK